MASLSKEEKIAKLAALINEGKNLIVTKSFQSQNFSYDVYEDDTPTYDYYTDVNDDAFPGWRMKSLALLKGLLGGHSTYVKEFEENCKPHSEEHNVKNGIGILDAVKSGYQDDSILEEVPPAENKETKFQIINVNENRNDVKVEYNVSNFDVLINSIEKSNRPNKEELVKEIKNIQKELEDGNPTWETMKKWTIFALGLGKDLGINLLANIIAKSANLG